MTFPSTEQQRRAAPEPANGSPLPRRRRAGSVVAAALGTAWLLAAACTLTSDGFEPPLVAADPLDSPTPEPVPVSSPDASACEGGAQCCTGVPCPGDELCVAGACQAPAAVDAGPPDCVGSDCPGATPVPLAPSCDDGVQNGDETGSDCGGSCTLGCGVGDGCGSDADCADGFVCAPEALRCAEVSCTDEQQNGGESDVDCGGTCPGCGDGSDCNTGADCTSGVCGNGGTCAAPTCQDGQKNGTETGVDCGGTCPLNCADGVACERGNDCVSAVCGTQGCADGAARCCQAPSCDDDVRNGTESDVDCGNAACGLCSLGDSCVLSLQCNTGLCQGGVCVVAPRCDDNVQNGTESDVDCGGICGVCPDLADCNQDSDCVNNNCDVTGVCISCGDNVRNGTETGVDCGGADPFCRRCNPGELCSSNTDCLSLFCLGGFCA